MLFQRKENSEDDEEEDADNVFHSDGFNPKKHVPVLKDLGELQQIFQEPPYHLDWLVSKVEKVLQLCYARAFPDETLANQTNLSGLKRGRATILKQPGS